MAFIAGCQTMSRLSGAPLKRSTSSRLTSVCSCRTAWARVCRPSQTPPDGDWRFWLLMMGRGAGKTRTGAEYVRAEVNRLAGQIKAGRARWQL